MFDVLKRSKESHTVLVIYYYEYAFEVKKMYRAKKFVMFTKVSVRKIKEESKGERWMPWLYEAKKDVVSCEKRRVGANDL